MNLLDMMVKFTVDTGDFETAVKNAGDTASKMGDDAEKAGGKIEKLGPLTYAAGQIIVDAIEKAGQVVVNFAKDAANAAIEYETSMAKVSTIMDTTQVSTEDMSGSIMTLSSEMGIAAGDIADSVYNVISATGDTANAVSLVETATKLAKGGFAETADATSVLTTAINAYGLEMEDAASISDSLITVQNLGVTTVGELASQMGKAIATGASYGVNLSNLETGYIALTKSGIGTAESTTYLSSMINELGKEGSTVADTLKDKTGKSFGQLMEDGYSLSDVLGVLNDSVDGDSEALANLWSSAEAGKASSAIVGQGLEEFNGWLNEVENSAGATQTAYETMSDTTEEKIAKLKTTFQNLSTEAVTPLVDKASEFIPKIQEFVESFDVEEAYTKLGELKDKLEEMEPIIAGVAAAMLAYEGYTTAAAIATGVKAAMDAAGATTLWGLAAAQLAANAPLIAVVAIIGLVVAAGVYLYKNWDTVKEKATELATNVKTKFNEIKTSVTTSIDNAKQAALNKFDAIKSGIEEKINSAKDAVGNAIDKIKSFMDFSWSLPKPKIPTFSVSGGKAPWGFMGQGSLPSISIGWKWKAMDNPMMFTSPTVLATASGMQGFGDAGSEVVIGKNTMLNMVRQASSEGIGDRMERVVELLEAIWTAVLDGKAIYLDGNLLVGGTINTINRKLGEIAYAEARG